MLGMDGWDALLFSAAAFVAVTSLVRLMRARRDELIDEIKTQIAAERDRRKKKKKGDVA